MATAYPAVSALPCVIPVLLDAGTSHGSSRFSGTAEQGKLFLGILGAVELFGIFATCYGLWQIVTGRRSKWVIYFAIGFGVLFFLIALLT